MTDKQVVSARRPTTHRKREHTHRLELSGSILLYPMAIAVYTAKTQHQHVLMAAHWDSRRAGAHPTSRARPGARQTRHQWGSTGSVDGWSPELGEAGL